MPARKNPGGGKGQDKLWADALRVAAFEPYDEQRKKLRRIAEVVVDLALGGDLAAAKEIGDRLDGKAVQRLAGDEDGEPISLVIERVIRDRADSHD